MFRNLYFFSPNFRNHNFSDFFDDIREDSEVYLEAALKEGYADGGLEPYFYSILPLTMSPESCASFIRANPQLPITERDYYLSKLFQFLYVPIKIRFSLEDGETDVREKVQ